MALMWKTQKNTQMRHKISQDTISAAMGLSPNANSGLKRHLSDPEISDSTVKTSKSECSSKSRDSLSKGKSWKRMTSNTGKS